MEQQGRDDDDDVDDDDDDEDEVMICDLQALNAWRRSRRHWKIPHVFDRSFQTRRKSSPEGLCSLYPSSAPAQSSLQYAKAPSRPAGQPASFPAVSYWIRSFAALPWAPGRSPDNGKSPWRTTSKEAEIGYVHVAPRPPALYRQHTAYDSQLRRTTPPPPQPQPLLLLLLCGDEAV